MKICIRCQKEFEEIKSFEKYCSFICCRRANAKKSRLKRKNDPERFNKYREKENARRRLKRDKAKHALQEKNRYRLKNNIKSDLDLKCAPKGSGTITKHGYRQIIKHDHPNAWKNGGMFEHVFIMSEYLGRPLRRGETVHHKNGIRSDNRIENLELWSNSHPYGQRVEDKIAWCKEFLEIYGFDVIKKIIYTNPGEGKE